jgi:hypothetical protein
MINIFFWIASLFTSPAPAEKPVRVYQDPECGMTVKQFKEMMGKPDKEINCHDTYINLRYGEKYYFFVQDAYMGDMPLHRYIDECVDNTRNWDFHNVCKG